MAWQKVAQSFALNRYRRHAEKEARMLSFSELLQETERVLVCLPETALEYERIVSSLGAIRKSFPKAHVTLLQSSAIPVPPEMARGFQLIVWGAADQDRRGGPSAAFKQRIFTSPYDVVIDLNHTLQFFSLAVVMESAAPVRAGYADPMREELYTFLLRPGTGDPVHALKALLVYLGRPEPARAHLHS
jgi:hypothetical protein